MLSQILGQFLQRVRKQLGISRQELAHRAQVSTRLVAELERGDRPNVSLESALRLLNLVGVSIVATAPDGSTAEIRDANSAARERAARTALRRRTWSAARSHLHESDEAPDAGRSDVLRLSAVSKISKEAFGLASVGRSGGKRDQKSTTHPATKTRRFSRRRPSAGDR